MRKVADAHDDLETEDVAVNTLLPKIVLSVSPKHGVAALPQSQQAPAVDVPPPAAADAAADGLARVSFLRINCMLCLNLANGVLLASYMLLVLPLESQRIDNEARSVVLATLMFIAGVTQLISPMVGLISDRCLCSWGRRRPFIVFGGLLGAMGIVVQAYASARRIPALYFAAYCVSMLALTTAYTAVVAVMPDLIPPEQSGTASGVAALHTLAGANMGFVVYYAVPGSIDDRLFAIYMSFVVITLLCVLFTACSCREFPITGSRPPEPTKEDDAESIDREKDQLTRPGVVAASSNRCLSMELRARDVLDSYYIDPRKHPDFSLVFWSRTFYYLGASVQAFYKYYLKDVVEIEDAEAAIITTAMVGQLCAAATAIPTGLLSDRIGRTRKPFIYAACAVLAVGQLANCFVRNEAQVIAVCAVLGCANGVYLAMDAALALDTLPSGEEAARFMGVWGVGCFLGSAFGPVVGGPVLAFSGKNPDNVEAYSYMGYTILFTSAAACFLLSGAILRYVGSQADAPWASCTSCVCLRRRLRRAKSIGLPAQENVSTSLVSRCLGIPRSVCRCCGSCSSCSPVKRSYLNS